MLWLIFDPQQGQFTINEQPSAKENLCEKIELAREELYVVQSLWGEEDFWHILLTAAQLGRDFPFQRCSRCLWPIVGKLATAGTRLRRSNLVTTTPSETKIQVT